MVLGYYSGKLWNSHSAHFTSEGESRLGHTGRGIPEAKGEVTRTQADPWQPSTVLAKSQARGPSCAHQIEHKKKTTYANTAQCLTACGGRAQARRGQDAQGLSLSLRY